MLTVGFPLHRRSLVKVDTDRYQGDLAVEAFTCLLIFKNVFSFGLTFGAYDWLVAGGIFKIFIVIASVQVCVCLLSIPMCESPKKNSVYHPEH